MALDLYISSTKYINKKGGSKYIGVSLEENGYYWYMYSFFNDLKAETGQMIGLYNDSYFCGEDLEGLQRKIHDIQKSIGNKTDEWRVEIGKEKRKPLYNLVEKEEFKSLLEKLLRVIERAKTKNKYLAFIGD